MIRFGSKGSLNEGIRRCAYVLDSDEFRYLPRRFKKAGREWGFTYDGHLYHGTSRASWQDVRPGIQVLHLTADRSTAEEFAWMVTDPGEEKILLRLPLSALAGWELGPDENLMEEEGETDILVSASQVGHITVVGDIEALKSDFTVISLGVR